MKPHRLLILLITFSFITSSAQMMNVRKWRKSERDSLDNGLLLMDENYFVQAVPIFEQLLKNHPKEDFLKYSYGRAALHRPDKHADAYTYLSEIYGKNRKLPDIAYEMAQAAHFNYRFDEAMEFAAQYAARKKLRPEEREKVQQLQNYIRWAAYYHAKPTAARITNAGDAINTEWDEYAPAITADESMMIFTYTGSKSLGGLQNAYLQEDLQSGAYMEDIYRSDRENGIFSKAIPVDSLNTTAPDAAVSLSNDGSMLFLYRDIDDWGGDLYASIFSGSEPGQPFKLKGNVNSYSWDGHCSLSPDGKTLYFSSERGGGFGGRDIYRASLSADSSWTNIVNLGDSVNTPLDDDAPFIHADGRSLFFSSRGRSSMGGFDIFRAMMNPADSTFRQVSHLGYPVNSPSDDIYFVLAANAKRGYYSSARSGGKGMKDIYVVEPDLAGPAPALCLVTGSVTASGGPVTATVSVDQKDQGTRAYGTWLSGGTGGKYLFSVPAGANYQVSFTYSTFPAQQLIVDTRTLSGYRELHHNIDFSIPPPDPTVAPVTATPSAAPLADRDGFVPQTKLQAKTLRYLAANGDVQRAGLEFRVQLAAVKTPGKNYFPGLAKYGRIEKLRLGDGFIRLTIGGPFRSLKKAFALNKKIVRAGQGEAFVIAVYKGQRVQFEDLVRLGIFKIP